MTVIATVIIPLRNEEDRVADCLRSIALQDVGPDALQVVVADGCSSDRTSKIAAAEAHLLGFGRFDLVENPAVGIAAGLNQALSRAVAPVVVRADARSRLRPGHVRRVIELLDAMPDIGIVGGGQRPSEEADGVIARAIERSLSNRLTTGLARYRWAKAPTATETVWLGAFRRDELRTMGGWNEHLVANEDFDLCERYRTTGRTVWFDPVLTAEYVPRETLAALWSQYWKYGVAKGRRWRGGAILGPRHALLLVAPFVLIALAIVGVSRTRRGVVGALGAGLVLVDVFSDRRRHDPALVRLVAPIATSLSSAAWWLGVLIGFISGSPSPSQTPRAPGSSMLLSDRRSDLQENRSWES